MNPLEKVKAPRGVRSVTVRFYEAEDMAALYEAKRRGCVAEYGIRPAKEWL